MTTDTSTLWADYHADRSIENRNRLVVAYLNVVDLIARRVGKRLRPADLDDMKSAGWSGLINAVERFEPARGLKFETFAGHRIAGAMLDFARNADHLSRTTRVRIKKWEAAADLLFAKMGRQPTHTEVEAVLGIERGAWDIDVTIAGWAPLSLNVLQRIEEDNEMELRIVNKNDADVGSGIESAEEFEHMLATHSLEPRERLALRMQYGEDRRHWEIAPHLNRSAVRVSQIIADARAKIRAALAA